MSQEKYLERLMSLEKEPATPWKTFLIADTLWELGRYSEAAEKFSQRADMGGAPEEVYCSLWRVGECFGKLGKPPEQVASALYRAYFSRPTRFEALVSLCRMLRESQRYDVSYRISMIHPTRSPDALLLDRNAEWQILEEHGLAAQHLAHVDEAREYFDLVSAYDLPAEDRSRIEEAIKIASEKPKEEALTRSETVAKVIIRGALEITPVEVTAKNQDLANAEKLVEQNQSPANFLNLSFALYQVNRPVDCIEAARKALELKPDYAEAYNNIAAAHLKLSEWEAAADAAREALRIDPNNQLSKNNLAAAEEKIAGRKKKSKKSKK